MNVTQPVQVDALCGLRVIGVDAGLGHTVVCTDSGGAYSWGWGSEGQLGHGKDASLSQPQLIESGAAASEDIVEASDATCLLLLASEGPLHLVAPCCR